MRALVSALLMLSACGSRSALPLPEEEQGLDATAPPTLITTDAAPSFRCTDASTQKACFSHEEMESLAGPNPQWDENRCLRLDHFARSCCRPDFGPQFMWEDRWGHQTCCYFYCRDRCC